MILTFLEWQEGNLWWINKWNIRIKRRKLLEVIFTQHCFCPILYLQIILAHIVCLFLMCLIYFFFICYVVVISLLLYLMWKEFAKPLRCCCVPTVTQVKRSHNETLHFSRPNLLSIKPTVPVKHRIIILRLFTWINQWLPFNHSSSSKSWNCK